MLIAAGILYSWWDRVQLGDMWSGRIASKDSHTRIDTAPYAILRHPLYTGILMAVYVSASVQGTIPGLFGLVFITEGV